MAAQFAMHDEFAARLGLTLTADEETRADTLLALASGLIQQETRQQIELVTDDVLAVRSTHGDRLLLPERPVVSVSSVVLTLIGGGATFDVPNTTYYVDRDELVRTSWPLVTQFAFPQFARGWLGPLYQIEVTYTHGFQVIPELVKAVCMEMVTRVWVNPGSVARETVGNTYTVYDNMRFSPTGLLMTDEEKKQLNELLRRQAGTVALR